MCLRKHNCSVIPYEVILLFLLPCVKNSPFFYGQPGLNTHCFWVWNLALDKFKNKFLKKYSFSVIPFEVIPLFLFPCVKNSPFIMDNLA